MKAIKITDIGSAESVELEKPVPGLGEVLLRIKYVGFCGSDLNTFRGFNPLVNLPIIPGHEVGAVIDDIGEGVPETIKIGMNATVNPYCSCGKCSACLNNRPNACEFNQTLGVQRNGAMAEYIVMPWQKVVSDNKISARDFALVEPMSVGFHAVNRGDVKDSDIVMVIGCGMIGLGAIVSSVHRGAKVIAVDVDDKKLELAKELGASYTINSIKDDVHKSVMKYSENRGADVVIEAVGRPETYQMAVSEFCFTGCIVYIGYSKEKVSFDTQYFVKKEIDIRGSRNATPKDFNDVINYLKQGICPIEKFISGIYLPDQAQIALENWALKPGDIFRILINFDD